MNLFSRFTGLRAVTPGSESCIGTSSRVVSFCGDIMGDWIATHFLVEWDEDGVSIPQLGESGRGIVFMGKCWQ